MKLSGLQTFQNRRYNELKFLPKNSKLRCSLLSRKDTNLPTNNFISWGDSVIIGIDNNISANGYDIIASSTTVDKFIKIFDLSGDVRWKVLNVSEHWIVISNIDSTAEWNFLNYYNSQKPSTQENFKIEYQNSFTRYIRFSEDSTNYNDLNVVMKSLDTLNEGVSFGSMKMKTDMTGNIIVYNLPISFFVDVEEKNIGNASFDLCVDSSTYQPIITGLKFEEKILDLDYLVFSHFTNNSKQYIIFTTNSIISEYAVYPDVYVSDNLYNNISNDYKIPSLFNNLLNDTYVSELLQMFTPIQSHIITTNDFSYSKEVATGDIIKNVVSDYSGNETLQSYTVLTSDNYLTEVPICDEYLGDSTTGFNIAHSGSLTTYTYNSTGTNPRIQIRLKVGDRITINSTTFSSNNNGTFIVYEVGADYFVIQKDDGTSESGKVLNASNSVTYQHVYLKSYENKTFLVGNSEYALKRYYLNNLFLNFEFGPYINEVEFRMVSIQYVDSDGTELLYLAYTPAMKIFIGEAKTFRLMV